MEMDKAIQQMREAVNAASPDQSDQVITLFNLAALLDARYSQLKLMDDLDEMILVIRKALRVMSASDPNRASLLNNLSLSLGDRYTSKGDMLDLQDAIRVVKEGLEITLDKDPDRAIYLNTLGMRLGDMYAKTGAQSYLDKAIQTGKDATKRTSMHDPNHLVFSNNLSTWLVDRYHITGDVEDLSKAIRISQEVLDMAPKEHPQYNMFLNNRSNLLGERFLRKGTLDDLENAISLSRKAVKMTPKAHPNRSMHLNSLGIRLGNQYEITGAIKDLEESITAIREAVKATPKEHILSAQYRNSLTVQLQARYSKTEQMTDLKESIELARDLVKTVPDSPYMAAFLNSMAIGLEKRYSRTGAFSDLDDAIDAARRAVEQTLKNHISKPIYLNSLALCLTDKYRRVGGLVDIEEAIRLTQEAVEITPGNHPDRAMLLGALGIRLSIRYERLGTIDDLDKAIENAREAVKTETKGHLRRAMHLGNLANHLGHKYHETLSLADLEEAVNVSREAAEAVPEGHSERSLYLLNLAIGLSDRYEKTQLGKMEDLEDAKTRSNRMKDLEEAIIVARKAVEILPEIHAERSRHLSVLGHLLGEKYRVTQESDDLGQAITILQSGLLQSNCRLSHRLFAGRKLLEYYAMKADWLQAYDTSRTVLNLVHKLAPRSLGNVDKPYQLSQGFGLACDAAAIALNANQGPYAALSSLEEGRGVLAASIEEIPIDIMDLKELYPEKAAEFVRLRNVILGVPGEPTFTGENSRLSGADEANGRRNAYAELDGLIEEVRTLQGFHDFLLVPSEVEVREAATIGPIVVINVSKYRCDAILVESDQIRNLTLPKLQYSDIHARAKEGSLGSFDTLKWLWNAAMCPILNALGFKEPASDGNWPRLWWIPTGALSEFPLHAAGDHVLGPSSTVIDKVMSSYSPSIKSIIHGRRRTRANSHTISNPAKALLVAMEYTPKHSRLSFVTEEIKEVRSLCKSLGLQPVEPGRRKADVISHLARSQVFHFAGHGHTARDPSSSYLVLEDGDNNPLDVATLLEMNIRSKSPFMAYLSACGTNRVYDGRLLDESINLVSAFQLAGFRNVVGTLWDVNDMLCVKMARLTYETIHDRHMEKDSVCQGLHKATKELRDCWLREFAASKMAKDVATGKYTIAESEENKKQDRGYVFVSEDNADNEEKEAGEKQKHEEMLLKWVPFVHFGIE